MDDELDIDALDELLGQELMEAGEDHSAPKTVNEQDTPDRNSGNESASTAAIEKQLREMQEKMEILRRQLETQKSSQASQSKGDSASKCAASGSRSGTSVAARKPLKLVDEDIFSAAKEDGRKEPSTSMEKSVVHSGDTDSSDDEKRYPTEAGLSKMGKSIKKTLEERRSSGFSSRPHVDTLASSKKEMISITAKDLLKMHNGGMKSPAGGSLDPKRTASTLQAKGLNLVSPIGSASAPLTKLTALTPSEIAKLRAAKKLSAKAPLVRQDPNAVKKDTTSSEVQAKIQRKLEEPTTSQSRKEARGDELVEMPAAKKCRLGPALTKEEVEKLLRQKSSHAHQVDDIEQEQEEQYFSVLEKKEQLEEKMLSVTEIQCDVVSCRKCNYTAQQASDLCKRENHVLKHHKAMKRFFRCKDCSHRTVTFARVPAHSCRKCNGSNYERTSMGKLSRKTYGTRGNDDGKDSAALFCRGQETVATLNETKFHHNATGYGSMDSAPEIGINRSVSYN
ncbi:hypothetical protein HPB50_001605 [Hyalomma asiaticum]|uniref:Uncharacterized protein n=1 Tax=Hyalomma asiaticum TaxID=266040 RepID=A0ACB7S074_HYAAI|nr:hypothetical protein HPB50_001605 [Hyalomma asiaticum]